MIIAYIYNYFMNHKNQIIWLVFFLNLGILSNGLFATNYYFDPASGNDQNDGMSMSQPFRSFQKLINLCVKQGDSILLKSGAVFTEKLYFSGKGSTLQPIVIGRYGGTVKPYLKGDASDLQMIHIYNSENIIVRDLEISNKGQKIRPYLNGILVELKNYGVGKNITLDNLFVHDVYGSLIKGEGNNHKDSGGGQAIMIRNLQDNETDSIPSRFDGLIVQNCYIKDCQRNGIMMWGNWVRKHWFPSTNVVIRRNVIDGVPGDGIVPVGCEAPLVEYNIMKNCPATLPATEACDGIWPWSCDNAVIQYNIVSDHKSQVDAYGFDSDYNSTNSLFQYNLSFNNDGGFLLLCNSGGWTPEYSVGNRNTVVRYNISINDGIRQHIVNGNKHFSPVIHITGSATNSKIEYNLIYVLKKTLPETDRTIVCSDDWQGFSDSTFFLNNYIFVEEPNVAFDPTQSTNNFFEGNRYIGPLTVSSEGFEAYKGNFDKKMWYNPQDKNWNKLIGFISDKNVTINGKEIQVVEIIGWKKSNKPKCFTKHTSKK